jgi:hypothetical protein
MSKSRIALCVVAIVVFANFVAAAKDDGVPTIDVQKLCRIRAAQSANMMGDKSLTTTAFDSCVRSEQEARAALVAAWKDIPQAYKTFCVRPNVYSPSQTEWIACIESNIDVRRLRSKKAD